MTVRYIGDALINEENINKTRIIIANQSKNNISGVIAETFHKVKLKKILKNTKYNSYESSSDSESMEEAQYKVSNFNLAVLFTLNEFCKVTITFKQNGFWLRRSKPIYDRMTEEKIIVIGKEHISDIVKWYELLQKATYPTISEAILCNIKKEVFNIAIKCLKKLLQDEELIKLKPSNRYKKVLEL